MKPKYNTFRSFYKEYNSFSPEDKRKTVVVINGTKYSWHRVALLLKEAKAVRKNLNTIGIVVD